MNVSSIPWQVAFEYIFCNVSVVTCIIYTDRQTDRFIYLTKKIYIVKSYNFGKNDCIYNTSNWNYTYCISNINYCNYTYLSTKKNLHMIILNIGLYRHACFHPFISFLCSFIDTSLCISGYYCPSGTVTATQYACMPGTYSDSKTLTSAEECLPCPAGKFCSWGTGRTCLIFVEHISLICVTSWRGQLDSIKSMTCLMSSFQW